jgi:nitrogen fixation protein FixH
MNPAYAQNLIPAGRPASRRRWPMIIVGLLVGHTALMIAFVCIATRDKSFSVDPDYYGKAVHWDQSQAEQRASDALGWQATIRPEEVVDEKGERTVVFELTDANGAAVSAMAIDAVYFHHAHGNEVRKATFKSEPSDPRHFLARLPMSHTGTWEFHVTAHAGEKLFVKTMTIDMK